MTGELLVVRQAVPLDVEPLADIWLTGWQDGHAGIVPADLARVRTRTRFEKRLQAGIAHVRLAERDGTVLGFSMIKDNELNQFYVAAEARGTNVSSALMRDALEIFRQRGEDRAWLACAIGNVRAARFYEKAGWSNVGTATIHLPTQERVFDLDVWRFEIQP